MKGLISAVNSLISVIVLSYKNLQYYKDCLNSILAQDYDNVEIIIGDDGSPDFYQYDLENYINSNKKDNIKSVKIYNNNKNMGVVKNYNKAIRMSNGEFIFYIGMDDMLSNKHTLTDIVDFFHETNCLIFTAYRDVYDEKMENLIERLPKESDVEILKNNNPMNLYKHLLKGNIIAGSCTPFAKRIVDTYGYIDEEYILLEDWARYLKLTREDCNIFFLNKPLIKYRLGGITTNINNPVSETLSMDFRKTILKEKNLYIFENMKNKNIVWLGRKFEYLYDILIKTFNIKSLTKAEIYSNDFEVSINNVIEQVDKYDKDEVFVFIDDEAFYDKLQDKFNYLGFREYKHYSYFTFSDVTLLKLFLEYVVKMSYAGDERITIENNFLQLCSGDEFFQRVIQEKLNCICNNMKGKQLVGFGTSGQYFQNQQIFKLDIDCFVDNNTEKHGKTFDGKIIYPVYRIKESEKESIFIVVFSQVYYKEISNQLKDMGYNEYEDFYSFTIDELKWLRKPKIIEE